MSYENHWQGGDLLPEQKQAIEKIEAKIAKAEAGRSHAAQERFEKEVTEILDDLREMLFAKNRKYGDAALNPQRTFATASAVELINVRLDDKLSRIKSRQNDEDEDPYRDMLGYLVLREIAVRREKEAVESLRQSHRLQDYS